MAWWSVYTPPDLLEPISKSDVDSDQEVCNQTDPIRSFLSSEDGLYSLFYTVTRLLCDSFFRGSQLVINILPNIAVEALRAFTFNCEKQYDHEGFWQLNVLELYWVHSVRLFFFFLLTKTYCLGTCSFFIQSNQPKILDNDFQQMTAHKESQKNQSVLHFNI